MNNDKKTTKPSGMKLAVLLTLLGVVVLAAIVILTNQPETQPAETAQMDISGQPTIGDEEAPVTVVEFGDFKCPSCKAWGEMIYPQLVEDYVETGDVKFSYINVLFHGEESTLASIAAESVYQQSPDVYWEFHKALYAEQPAQNHDALWVTPEKMLEIANDFPSIDQAQLEADMEQQATMEQVEIDEVLVEEAEVAQTPTIVVNGTTLDDPFDYEAIKALIEQELTGEE
ncbi:DsbA family protein [Planococcus sp. CP5-4]|uniref:DsbA family protein n=1 Tax=unclassified Planococcus (in: firmicutes) TaxID=2662419 RepID=UPI001C2313A4|nr:MULTISPECIES: DsbA family protein [unclassified Planococcus (in: firmicutes)]MBU9673374.1 DsbA family protein [Planococcus sp. CP5-4_YE]MBV0908147.1 DsbA family protein [Planococcus sp. CP5-4_UN]MBW6062208.1 DsbA family protein [Planococcus sp. CP5-4]